MRKDSSHITKIKIVSNTHWDREFRQSFEKTRHNLLRMMDVTLDILEKDPEYHSFTMDGHSIVIEDYLELRPEKKELVEKLISTGRLVIGPYYTLAEQFSIGHEALVRNMIWGRRTVEKYGGKPGTVAYTPSSWGQTGQLPQILKDFGLDKVMFYRGISHHEADAEYIWSAPDNTRVLASRFALYARYNWYYQVHRAVTKNRIFAKNHIWGEYDELPFRIADEEGHSFDLKDPSLNYDKSKLEKAVLDMVKREGAHFTTNIFLAMNGHDISVAHPLESKIITDAKEIFKDRYDIEHTDLEDFWLEVEKQLELGNLPVLTGERRSYLKEGMWTFLFPATISARTYLKQQDYKAYNSLVYYAEPMASMAKAFGADYPMRYMNRGWQYLLSNHTHDANGGCAPDAVCKDMEYRYRKVMDIGSIVSEEAMSYIAGNLSPDNQTIDVMQLVTYNTLPFERDAVVRLDLELPRTLNADSAVFESSSDKNVQVQLIKKEKSNVFVDSIWDVPTILDSNHIQCYTHFKSLPALGYRSYVVKAAKHESRTTDTLVTGHNTLENEHLKVKVNGNGTLDITNKRTGKVYRELNYLTDQGECGNAWRHTAPEKDRKYNSLGVSASVAVSESGPLTSSIAADYRFPIPMDCADGQSRSEIMVDLPVLVKYTLDKNSTFVKVNMTINNTAKDHWLRVNFPTELATNNTVADSHFDVLTRPIPLPDSTGWVEKAEGTHPLRTFVAMSNGKDGLALFPRGLFEYEAFDDERHTLALTLIRACRIKLAVSEEKVTELPDPGIQCPGIQNFEYAICIHEGDWIQGDVMKKVSEYNIPVRCALSGRGKGILPLEAGLFTINNTLIHVTAVKQAEDGNGLVIRVFNPVDVPQQIEFTFGRKITEVTLCRMDESILQTLGMSGKQFDYQLEPKKIRTFRIVLEG